MTTHTLDELITATFVATDADGKTNSYYALVLSKCKKYASKEVPTMGVCFDQRGKLVLLWNPDFLRKLTDGEAIAVLKHEAMHIFFKHLARFQTKKNHERVNIATDMAINQYLRGLPAGCQLPETYNLPRGLSADAYLKALEEQNIADQKKMKASGGQAGQSGKGGKGDKDDEGDGDGSSAGTDNHDTWDKVVDENGKIIGDTESEGVDTQSTLDRISRAVAQRMKEKGDTPAWATAVVENMDKKSKHNWKNELRVLVNSVLSTDKRRSQKHVDRRMICITDDFLFPGKKKDRKPSVLLVRDTSGSMFNPETQAAVLTEMVAISRRAEVLVCDCDVTVHQVYKVRKQTDFKEYKGGGGTSFVQPFEEAKKRNVDAVIYLTDLYGEFPDPRNIGKYARNTVWVTVEKDADTKDPPFGKVVRIQEEL